jgi:hypothetical protein
MEGQMASKKNRFQNIAVAICFLAAIGFFFYGLINNMQAKMHKEIMLQTMVRLKECEKIAEEHSKQLQISNQQLMQALEETKKAKDYAMGQAKVATELARKK